MKQLMTDILSMIGMIVLCVGLVVAMHGYILHSFAEVLRSLLGL